MNAYSKNVVDLATTERLIPCISKSIMHQQNAREIISPNDWNRNINLENIRTKVNNGSALLQKNLETMASNSQSAQ